MRMRTYIARRLLLLIPVLIGVTLLVFALTRFSDPLAAYGNNPHITPSQLERIRESLHLNEDYFTQYFYWLDALFKGDLGWSKVAGMEVSSAIGVYFPRTVELTIVSMVIATFVGIALGTLSAVRKDKPVDHATRVIALAGVCFPIFWLALIFQYIFYSQLGWFPAGHQYDELLYDPNSLQKVTGLLLIDTLLNGNLNFFVDVVWHTMLPATVLALGTIAILTRIMRSSMLEILNLDYIKTARSKGLPERTVYKKHARKNALLPTTTVVGLTFGGMLGGAVLTETIFAWPGMGWLSTQAIRFNETSVIMVFTIIIAIIYVFANLIVDLLYAYLDPRVRLG